MVEKSKREGVLSERGEIGVGGPDRVDIDVRGDLFTRVPVGGGEDVAAKGWGSSNDSGV